jgi:hypothetical protein
MANRHPLRFFLSCTVVFFLTFTTSALAAGTGYYLVNKKLGDRIQKLEADVITLTSKVTSLEQKECVCHNGNYEKLTGDYTWEDQTLQEEYQDALWNKIESGRLKGFSTSFTEKKTEGCGAQDKNEYLRIEGGLCRVGVWLEDTQGNKINSVEKLKETCAPIESEEEAISYLSLMRSDLKIGESDIPQGHSLTITDGFLIQLVYKNTFGCSNHKPIGYIYKVSKNGDFEQVATEQVDETTGPQMCVD